MFPLNTDFLSNLKKIRHHLHQHPETAYEEWCTAEFLKSELEKLHLPVFSKIGKTGLVAVLKRSETAPFVGFRADMDALPIWEENALPYQSQIKGKMHACGHDGHMAMLLGAAHVLAKSENFKGNVLFIFQPAEEGGAGAKKMMEEGLFEQFPCSQVFALHNWPGLEIGKMAIFPSAVMAGNCTIEIKIEGKACHAALPHEGDDLILTAAHFISALKNYVERQTPASDSIVLSLTKIHAGDALNVLPNKLFLSGTLRYFNPQLLKELTEKITVFTQGFAKAFQLFISTQMTPHYPPTINAECPTLLAQEVARKVLGTENVLTEKTPAMTSEDFAFMLEKIPGCYAWLGNGSSKGLHNPGYDFNDALLPLGVSYFVELAFSTVS